MWRLILTLSVRLLCGDRLNFEGPRAQATYFNVSPKRLTMSIRALGVNWVLGAGR